MGIIVCGLNGAGKTTLGKLLAERLGYTLIDVEDLYISKKGDYAASRPREEVISLLDEKIRGTDDFVFISVQSNYGDELMEKTSLVVYVKAPKEVRMARVLERQKAQLGNRLEEDPVLASEEADWLSKVEERTEEYTTKWFPFITCPIIEIDGTKPMEESVEYLLAEIKK